MLHVVLWKWHQPGTARRYTHEHVDLMAEMVEDNLAGVRHRVVCVTDDSRRIRACETYPLWDDYDDLANASGRHLPSCYRRLKLYDPRTQEQMGIPEGDRILSLDIDAVVCGDLTEIAQTEGSFVGWQVPGERGPRFNGSLQMFTAGDQQLRRVWYDFHPVASPRAASQAGFRGSDQAWLSYCLVGRPGSVGLGYPLVASYPSHVQALATHSAKTRLLFFNGSLKPWSEEVTRRTPWVASYWRKRDARQHSRASQSR